MGGLSFGGGQESLGPKLPGRIEGKKFVPPKRLDSSLPKINAGTEIKISLSHLGLKDQFMPKADLLTSAGFEKHFTLFKAELGSRLVTRLKELDSMKLPADKYAAEKQREMGLNAIYEVGYLMSSLEEWLYAVKDELPDDRHYILTTLRTTIANNENLIKEQKTINLDPEQHNKLIAIYLIHSFPDKWFKDSRNLANSSANFLIKRINNDHEERNIKAAIQALTKLILMKSALTLDDKKKISAGAKEMARYMAAALGATKYRQYPLLPYFKSLAAAFAIATRRS